MGKHISIFITPGDEKLIVATKKAVPVNRFLFGFVYVILLGEALNQKLPPSPMRYPALIMTSFSASYSAKHIVSAFSRPDFFSLPLHEQNDAMTVKMSTAEISFVDLLIFSPPANLRIKYKYKTDF